jgi:hypothetical protein
MRVSRRFAWWVVAAGFVVVLGEITISGMHHGVLGGDSEVLVRGVRVAFDCVQHGQYTHCGQVDQTVQSIGHTVGPFPLLQYLPAALAVGFGASVVNTLHALAWLNLAAFAGMFGLIVLAGRRLPSRGLWTPILLAVAASGPVYYYATAALGEMLAATMLLGAVVAALYRRPWLVGLTATLACLGKETLPPFVLLLVLVAARDRSDGWLPPTRLTVAAVGGTLTGAGLNALFDEFRYGTVTNRYYLEPWLRADSHVRVSFFGAVFAAPNGGLAWFWTAALLLFAAAAAWAITQAVRARRAVYHWGPMIVVVGLVVVWGAELAAWFSPFGWLAWGPRLFIPLIPAATVAVAHAGGPGFAGTVRRAFALPVVAAVLIVTAALCAWPEASAPWTWQVATPVILTPDAGCPALPDIRTHPLGYQRCEADIAWRAKPSILGRSLGHQNGPSGVTSTAVVVGILALAALARKPPDEPGGHGRSSSESERGGAIRVTSCLATAGSLAGRTSRASTGGSRFPPDDPVQTARCRRSS